MNVTLVSLPGIFLDCVSLAKGAPLGLLSLAGSIKDECNIKIVDMTSGEKLSEKIIMDTDVLGVGALTANVSQASQLLQNAKKINPAITTILGGPHISLYPEDATNYNGIDHFVIGEGERVFPKIIRGEIKTKVVQGEVTQNLDDLPFPAYELVNVSHYHFLNIRHLYTLEASRGCPYNCFFCSERKIYGAGYRMKTKKRLITELQLFDPKFVVFSDSNFGANISKTMEQCDGMIETGDRMYMCHIRVDTIAKHPDLISKMVNAGFIVLWTGIDYYRDGVDWEQIKHAKHILDDYGIQMVGELMIGGLNDTERDIRNYFKKVRSLNPDFCSVSILTPFPNTEFRDLTDDSRFMDEWQYYDGDHCVFHHPIIDFKKMHELRWEMQFHLIFDPVAGTKRWIKALHLYRKKYKIMHKLLDLGGFARMVSGILKLYFWDSNKIVEDINKIFTKKSAISHSHI